MSLLHSWRNLVEFRQSKYDDKASSEVQTRDALHLLLLQTNRQISYANQCDEHKEFGAFDEELWRSGDFHDDPLDSFQKCFYDALGFSNTTLINAVNAKEVKSHSTHNNGPFPLEV